MMHLADVFLLKSEAKTTIVAVFLLHSLIKDYLSFIASEVAASLLKQAKQVIHLLQFHAVKSWLLSFNKSIETGYCKLNISQKSAMNNLIIKIYFNLTTVPSKTITKFSATKKKQKTFFRMKHE